MTHIEQPEVIREDVTESFLVQRTDSVGNWGPWSGPYTEKDEAAENRLRDVALDAEAFELHGADLHEFRVLKITASTKHEVVL